jgi:hypothetical protein
MRTAPRLRAVKQVTRPARGAVYLCARFVRGTGAMSNQWKANVLTALIVLVLALACAHSYGIL